jgi:hypothetical protein
MTKYYLDAGPRFNHGCSDYAIFEDTGDGNVTCIWSNSCNFCWSVGHDNSHVYYKVGDVRTVESILTDPDYIKTE